MSTELRLVCGKKPDDPDLEEAEDIKVRVEVTLHDESSSYTGSHLVINKSLMCAALPLFTQMSSGFSVSTVSESTLKVSHVFMAVVPARQIHTINKTTEEQQLSSAK